MIEAAKTIKKQLLKKGFLLKKEVMSYDTFFEIANHLGTVKTWTDINVDHHSKALVKTIKPMALHNDCCFRGLVAWFCVEQDRECGETVLIDTVDLNEYFTDSEINDLGNIYVYIKGEGHTPLYRDKKVYCVPWAIVPPTSKTLNDVLLKFKKYLAYKQTKEAIYVRLEPGQSLFIDDNRILHGRPGLSEGSVRLLKRAWIEVD